MSHMVYMFFFINTLNNKTKHKKKWWENTKWKLPEEWGDSSVCEMSLMHENLHKKPRGGTAPPGNLALEAVLGEQVDPQRILAAH